MQNLGRLQADGSDHRCRADRAGEIGVCRHGVVEGENMPPFILGRTFDSYVVVEANMGESS